MRFNRRLRASVRGLPFKCKATKLAMGGDYFFQEKSRNLHRITGLLIKRNSFALSPNLAQQTGPYSPSLLISCSVTSQDFAWIEEEKASSEAFVQLRS